MRFVDANIFIYAFLKPRRKLKPEDEAIKKSAKEIVSRINQGEDVRTTVVHVSEVANFLEDWIPLSEALTLEEGILSRESIQIEPMDENACISAVDLARENSIGLNDALAVRTMQRYGQTEIYSFDKHFDKISRIKRITQ